MDLSPVGETKIPVVEECARAFAAEVLLLHIVPTGAIAPGHVTRTEAVARTYLDTVVARLRGAGLTAYKLLRTGAAAPRIVEQAESRKTLMIIIGTNVRPVLPSVVLGSVADKVVRNAPCPVLLVHPDLHAPSATELRSFHQDAERAGVLTKRALGVRTIEVARVVGSVGRHRELGPDLRPLERQDRKVDQDRFTDMLKAAEAGMSFPSIDVYKLGFGYYVLDGHHRVALALHNAQPEIEANVIEFVTAADEQSTTLFRARRAFELATGLTEVGASRLETYDVFQQAIQDYQAEHGLDDLLIAARRWYTSVFHPLWQAVRARQLHADYYAERTADTVARMLTSREVSSEV